MQTNTDKSPDQNEVAEQPSSGSTVFMLTREDLDHSKCAIFGAEFDMSIDFISAESEDDVLAYQAVILESEGFEIDCFNTATNGSVESVNLTISMNKAAFWEWIEEHFDECIHNLIRWAAHNGIEAAALLEAADCGKTPGHLALAQHGQFRSVVEEFVLKSTATSKKTGKSSRVCKSL
jgi:hypothetical protein